MKRWIYYVYVYRGGEQTWIEDGDGRMLIYSELNGVGKIGACEFQRGNAYTSANTECFVFDNFFAALRFEREVKKLHYEWYAWTEGPEPSYDLQQIYEESA